MTKETVEDDREDGRVELVEIRGKTVEIIELKRGTETELSLEQSNLTNSGVSSLAFEEHPMEVEIVTRTATSAAETAMSIEPPCTDPSAWQQSIFEPESIVEPLPMSTEPKDAALPIPVAMSVSPRVESATDMKSDTEEGSQSLAANNVNKVCLDEPQKSVNVSRKGEKSRQGIRVLLPKGESEQLDPEEEDLGSTAVETLHCNKGGQDEEDALFKSPIGPAIPSPARTATGTPSAPLDSPLGSQLTAPANPLLGSGQSLGNLSPASLPSPGYTPPRSIFKT